MQPRIAFYLSTIIINLAFSYHGVSSEDPLILKTFTSANLDSESSENLSLLPYIDAEPFYKGKQRRQIKRRKITNIKAVEIFHVTLDNKPYALKVVDKQIAENEIKIAIFANQLKQSTKYYGNFLTDDDSYVLAFDFIEGKTIADEIAESSYNPVNKLRENKFNQEVKDLANKMLFFHHHGYCLNDWKNSNLMRSADDHQIHLIDFGTITRIGEVPLEDPAPAYVPPWVQDHRGNISADYFRFVTSLLERMLGKNILEIWQEVSNKSLASDFGLMLAWAEPDWDGKFAAYIEKQKHLSLKQKKFLIRGLKCKEPGFNDEKEFMTAIEMAFPLGTKQKNLLEFFRAAIFQRSKDLSRRH